MREAKDWSLHKLAKRSGISEKVIAKLEADPRQVPSWLEISKLASALNTNPIYLATGDGKDKAFHLPHGGPAQFFNSNEIRSERRTAKE